MSPNYLMNTLVAQWPLIAVYVIGFVVSLARWQRHPRVSSLVLTAMCICLGSILFFAVFNAGALVHDFERALHMRLGEPFVVASMLRNGIHAVGLAILLMGAFAGREQAQRGFAIGPMGAQPPMGPPPMPRR